MATDITFNVSGLISPPQARLFLCRYERIILPRSCSRTATEQFAIQRIGYPDGDLFINVPIQGVVPLSAPVLISIVVDEEMNVVISEFWKLKPAEFVGFAGGRLLGR